MEDFRLLTNRLDGLDVHEDRELLNNLAEAKEHLNTIPANQLYDQLYYQNYSGANLPYSRDQPQGSSFFEEVATKIVNRIRPGSVLDAGCAYGFLVESLRDLAVEAYGLDISEYAIAQVRPAIQPFCTTASLLEPLPRHYNLIVCLEVFQQLRPEEAEQVAENFARSSDDLLFSATPYNYAEPTNQNVQEPAYWAALFARYGFQHDLEFDASFISGWAMRLRKTSEPLPAYVQAYEHQLWNANRQLEVLRGLVLGSRREKVEKEQALQQLQVLQTELQTATQVNQRTAVELQELRQSQTLAEQKATMYQQRAEEALHGFKVAQSRFRQLEGECDRQKQAALKLVETEQEIVRLQTKLAQAEKLVQVRRVFGESQDQLDQYKTLQNNAQWLEQDRQILLQNLARYEQDLRALEATRTVRVANNLSKLVKGPLHLIKSRVRGPIEVGLDLPTPESIIESRLRVVGWAYSTAARIDEVLVRLDDKVVGKAEYGLPRADVVGRRPWQLVLNCGFAANLELDQNLFPTGRYTFSVEVRDLSGNRHNYARYLTIKFPPLT